MACNTSRSDGKSSHRNTFNLLSSYIPTNKQTWNYAIPIIGVSLSCFSFGAFLSSLEHIKNWPILNTAIYYYGYLILAVAVSVELFFGLAHRSRRQYTFWILLKFFEIALLAAAIALEVNSIAREIALLTYESILLGVNSVLWCYVIGRSTKPQRTRIENVYEVPNAHQTTHVSVY